MATNLFAQAGRPTYILVHGGWHGAWCWNKVLPLMQAKGVPAVAIDMPGSGDNRTPLKEVSMDAYVRSIVEAAHKVDGPVILLGHSSGGAAVAQAAEELTGRKVRSIVFLDAFMPQNGESVSSLARKFSTQGPPPLVRAIVPSDGATSLDPSKVGDLFYHDCSPEDIAFAIAHLGPQPDATQAAPMKLTEEVYGAIDKYYIRCTEARDFDKTGMSANVPTRKVYTLNSSHSPFFSMPERLVGILVEISSN